MIRFDGWFFFKLEEMVCFIFVGLIGYRVIVKWRIVF